MRKRSVPGGRIGLRRRPSWTGSPATFELLETRFALDADGSVYEYQSASIADQIIDVEGYSDFKAATSLPSISPVLGQAQSGDLVVTYNDMVDPLARVMTAVVLKPRATGQIYRIPTPSLGENHYQFLQTHLLQAATQKAGTIVFPASFSFQLRPPIPEEQQPGGSLQQEEHLSFSGLRDVIVDLNGSTLQLLDKVVGIRIEDSQRMVIKNGTIRGSELLSTIAVVQPDETTEAGIKLDVLPQFETALEQAWAGSTPDLRTVGSAELGPDGRWRIRAEGYSEMFTNRELPHNNFVYRDGQFVATSHLLNNESPFFVGDHVWLLHENNSAHGLYLDNRLGEGIEDLTLENLIFENIAGMVVVGEIDRGLHVHGISIQVDSNLPGLLAASSDEIHINTNGGDIVVENSRLGPNGDDKVTIKGNYWRVTAIDSATNTLTVQPVDENVSVSRWGRQGDRLVFIDKQFGVLGQARLDADSSLPRAVGNRHTLKLDQIPATVQLNTLIGNVDGAGGRIVVRNNLFSETRAQGILVQSSHVVVEGNFFEGMGGPAIAVELALEDWYESINSNNIQIRYNAFSRTSKSFSKTNALVDIHQVDANENPVQVIDNVRIASNILFEPSIDRIVPAVTSIERVGESPSSAGEVSFRVTFSEPVSGVGIRDFKLDQTGLRGATISSVSGDGSTYLVNVHTGTGNGTLSIDFAPGARSRIIDGVANRARASFTEGETYTMERQPAPNPSKMDVVYTNKSPRGLSPEIQVQLDLINTEAMPQNWKGLEVRYYFSPDGSTPIPTLLSSSAPAEIIELSYPPTGGYLSIKVLGDHFVDAADELTLQFLITNEERRNFDQSNDRSYNGSLVTGGKNEAIQVYLNSAHVWGNAPPKPLKVEGLRDDTQAANDFETTDRTLAIYGTWDELHSLALGILFDSTLYLYGFHPELRTDNLGRWTLDLSGIELEPGPHSIMVIVANRQNDSQFVLQTLNIL